MSTTARRIAERLDQTCGTTHCENGIPYRTGVAVAKAERIIDEEFASIIEQRDKAWLLAKHGEANVELERRLKGVIMTLKAALLNLSDHTPAIADRAKAQAAISQAKEVGL